MSSASARRRGLLSALGAALCAALCASALAHDSWLVAGVNSAPSAGSVRLSFITSEEFAKPDAPTDPARVQSFVILKDGVRAEPKSVEASDGALLATLEAHRRGLYVAAITLKPRYIEIEGPAFQRYLEDERASAALSVRSASGARERPGRELYMKCSKTFVEVGAPPPAGSGDAAAPLGRGPSGRPGTGERALATAASTPVGHPLEIIPLTNPCRWRVGERVTVRALLDGEPAPGVFISSGREGAGGHAYESTIRTDAKGEATFTFSMPGLWFLRTHSIRPLRDIPPDAQAIPEGVRPEWASFFASMTFRVGGR